MLVIASDLHLTDGTSGETIHSNAFRVFRERLRDLAYDASWRADGKYKPIEECHVVLVGDIFDVIRSTEWLKGTVRPWDHEPQSESFVDRVNTITNMIVQHNGASLAVLKSLHDGTVMTIPDGTQDGKPAEVKRDPGAPGRVPVAVRIHYMVGNHDWFFHLPGTPYNQMRRVIKAAIGLETPADSPFPHDPYESGAIQKIYADHGVLARHGDIFDPFNYDGHRDASSLGDAIVVELLDRFPDAVKAQMGSVLPKDCLDGLKEIDNVRPLLVIPVWVDGLLRRTCSDPAQIKQVKDIWDGLADQFLNIPFVKEHNSVTSLFDSFDKLEFALKFSKGVSLHTASLLLTWIKEKMVGSDERFYKNAFTEQAFKNRTARCIAYGHTHHHEIVPLDTSYSSAGLFNQVYLNSGTWRRVHELAELNSKDQEFVGYHVMTYLAFFKDGERGGRQFEAWSGALGT